MRSDASDEYVGGCESRASAAPDGGAASRAPAASGSAAKTRTPIVDATTQLAERGTRLQVEEVDVVGVDGDRDRVADAQLDARREGGDQIRPGTADDALAVAVAIRHSRLRLH